MLSFAKSATVLVVFSYIAFIVMHLFIYQYVTLKCLPSPNEKVTVAVYFLLCKNYKNVF